MGYSAGDAQKLKKADEHNRFGYWEYIPIRKISWETIPHNFKFGDVLTWPRYQIDRDNDIARRISTIADEDHVEIYKDNLLPLVYKQFDQSAKCIIISRNPDDCYASPLKAGMRGYDVDREYFALAVANYFFWVGFFLCHDMDCLQVEYEQFGYNFKSEVDKIAGFLGVRFEGNDYESLRHVYHPREY